MSNIILARLSASYDRRADRRVHSFEVNQNNEDGIRKAFCGFAAHYSVLEMVPALTGLGCELCIAETPTTAPEWPADAESWPPEDDPDSARQYAAGLRGEHEWHKVPERPITSFYERRMVVITECGVIGVLVFGEPRPHWRPCSACHQGQAEVSHD